MITKKNVFMKRLLFSLLLLILFTSANKVANASHAAGGELTYEHVSGNTYRFTFKFFRDCTGLYAPSSVPVCIYNLCSNSNLTTKTLNKISGNIPGTNRPNGSPTSTGCPGFQTKCQSSSSSVPGYQEWWYQGTYTLPNASSSCDEWRFNTYISARNGSTNINGGYFYAEAYLNRLPVVGQPAINNNSPTFSLAPIPYYCANQPTTYSNGTVEVDGDSLSFESITPMRQSGCNFTTPTKCTYKSSTFNPINNPFNTGNTFSVNSITGGISFTPNLVQKPTISIRVNEYRNGILIGYVMRDIQMVFLNCTTPNPVYQIDSNSLSGGTLSASGITICSGQQVNFNFGITSADSNAILTIGDNHLTQAINSSLSYSGLLTDSINGVFSWTPTLADTGLHLITINATDSACSPPGILISQTFTLALNVKARISIQATTVNPSCGANDGSVTAIATQGAPTFTLMPLNISNATGVFNNLGPGNFVVSIQGNSCANTSTINLATPHAISWDSIITTNVNCVNPNAGSISAKASGSAATITYSINPASASPNTSGLFSNLAANTYNVHAQDTSGCTADTAVNIEAPVNPILNLLSSKNPNCLNNNGNIIVTGTTQNGTLIYTLTPGAITNSTGQFTGLMSNSYSIIATDNAGCTETVSDTLMIPPNPNWLSSTSYGNSCFNSNNGSINVSANSTANPISYTLQPGNIVNSSGAFNNLNGGNYTVTASDTNVCDTVLSFFIANPLGMQWDSISSSNVVCYGENNGQFFVKASRGNGAIIYSVTGTSLSNSTGAFPNLAANNYTVVASDTNGCSILTSVQITQPALLQITSLDITKPSCIPGNDGTITIGMNGGTPQHQFSIGAGSQSSNIFTGLLSGNYPIHIIDANGCQDSAQAFVPKNPDVIIDSILFSVPTCFGDNNGIFEIFAHGGTGVFNFSTNASPFTSNAVYNNLKSGLFNIVVKDSLQCRTDTTFFLDQPAPVDLATIDIQNLNCKNSENGSALFVGKGGRGEYTYYIRPGIRFNKNGLFSNLKKGLYSISVVDSAQCKFDSLVAIEEPTLMNINFVKKNLSCNGFGNEGEAEVYVSGGNPPYTYLWNSNPPQFVSRAIGLRYGWKNVSITDESGCQILDSVYINPGDCCQEIFIPNAFSPNGDGRNDEFRVVSTAGIELLQFDVFNRWGQRVWSTYTYYESWDGTFSGKQAAQANYYYVYRYKCATDGQEYIKKGDLILMR